MIELPAGPFDLVMADPAWSFASNSKAKPGKNPMAHYDCMTLDDIKAMGEAVRAVSAPDALLWMWALNPMLPHALEVMQAWGFRFCTAGHWVKRTKNGKLAFGTGFVLRGAGEPFLIGKRGKSKTTRGVRSVIEGLVRAHSQKPEEAYREAERLMPDARRLDLFSRQSREGWAAWGKQAGMFDKDAAT